MLFRWKNIHQGKYTPAVIANTEQLGYRQREKKITKKRNKLKQKKMKNLAMRNSGLIGLKSIFKNINKKAKLKT